MNMEKIFLADYSKYSFVVSGDGTKEHKDTFKNMGGKWNPNLTLNGTAIKGWIFSLKKKNEVQAYLEDIKVEEVAKDFSAFDTATKVFIKQLILVDKSTQTEPEDVVDAFENLVVETPPAAPKLDNTYFACECGVKVLRKNRVRHLASHKQIIAEK